MVHFKQLAKLGTGTEIDVQNFELIKYRIVEIVSFILHDQALVSRSSHITEIVFVRSEAACSQRGVP